MWIVDNISNRVRASLCEPRFQRDPATISKYQGLFASLLNYYRADIKGAQHLPEESVLLVANHSGGLYTPEVYVILGWWIQSQGPARPLYMLAHDLLFALPLLGRLLRRMGGIPASQANAREALTRGSVIAFPGGDYEAFRPFWERGRIDFGSRTGYVRLALRAGVPLVPVVSHGSHDTTFVLTRGERLARWMGLSRLRSRIFPLVLGLPWGLAPGFLPFFPWPARITVRLLPPIRWQDRGLGPEAADDPLQVAACHAEVTGLMQKALDQLIAERPVPLFS